jgi:transcriptional regulator with XRE-family HTH domain
MTQTQAAAALGRPQSFIAKVEAGERRVDALELSALARLYGCPLAFFNVEPEGEMKEKG